MAARFLNQSIADRSPKLKSFTGANFGKELPARSRIGLFFLMGSITALVFCMPGSAQDGTWGSNEPGAEWGAPTPGGGSPSKPNPYPKTNSGTPTGNDFGVAPATGTSDDPARTGWPTGSLSEMNPYSPVAVPNHTSGTDDVSSILLPIPHAGTVLPPPKTDVPRPARDAVLPPPLETNSKTSLAWRNVAYSLLQQSAGRNLLIRYFKASYSQTMESIKEQAQTEGWSIKGQSIAAGHLLLEVFSQSGSEGAFIFAIGPKSDGTTEVRLKIGDSKRAQELATTFLTRAEERAMRKGAPLT